MTLSSLIRRTLVLMLGLALLGAGLAIWSSGRAEAVHRRVELANLAYENYAALRANAADLFKQYGDALLIGNRDKGADETRLRDAIRDNLATLRRITAAEILLVGSNEQEELDALSEIEGLVRRLATDMERIVARSRLIVEVETEGEDEIEIDIAGGQETLAAILDVGVDANLRTRIEEAMIHEAAEVAAAEAALLDQLRLARILALALLVASGLAAALVAWDWSRHVSRPLARLREGVRALSEGRYDMRLGLAGRSEIAAVGNVIDDLAAEVARREQSLSNQNAVLEARVAERTEDLARALKEARKVEEARRHLLADVSHELRTPLTIIKGEADVALRGPDKAPAEYREALTRTREAAVHTAALVDDLLFIGRAESGRPRLSLDDTDLRAVVEQAVAMADGTIPVISDGQPAPILADRARLRQAVLALVDNARQHGGPSVRVRLARTADGYQVRVEDDGLGLAEEDREMSFTRFWRGPGAEGRHKAGTGLGLPIVRGIAAAHGGRVWLEAGEPEGTAAVLELPRDARADDGLAEEQP